jgi:hypothetical protein
MSTHEYTVGVREYLGCVEVWSDVITHLPNNFKNVICEWEKKGWVFSHVEPDWDYDNPGPEFYAVGHRPMNDKERDKEEKRIAKESDRKKQASLKAKQRREEEKARTEAEELELLKKLKAKYEK